MLAALRPRMLELARYRTAGAHPYFVPPAHTARAREILGPAPVLAPEQVGCWRPTQPARARSGAGTWPSTCSSPTIEIDHLSERARETVLRMAEAARYPLVSSHTDTGGTWTTRDLRRLYAVGGFATARPDTAGPLARRILQLSRLAPGGVGLGTDTGGFAALPGPRADAAQHPLPYPFRSFDGRVRFTRERTGERVFDLNTDGVAHYGLFADLLADMRRTRRGTAALRVLFRSAEAYLHTWERAVAHR